MTLDVDKALKPQNQLECAVYLFEDRDIARYQIFIKFFDLPNKELEKTLFSLGDHAGLTFAIEKSLPNLITYKIDYCRNIYDGLKLSLEICRFLESEHDYKVEFKVHNNETRKYENYQCLRMTILNNVSDKTTL